MLSLLRACLKLWPKRPANPLVLGWYKDDFECLNPFSLTKVLNSSALNCGPLSGSICLGSPNLQKSQCVHCALPRHNILSLKWHVLRTRFNCDERNKAQLKYSNYAYSSAIVLVLTFPGCVSCNIVANNKEQLLRFPRLNIEYLCKT